MNKKILLPNNNFGACLMLVVVILVATVPFIVAAWLMLFIAPWWVAWPLALLVEMIVFLKVVKFKP